MSSFHNRIIKLKRPISGVAIVPSGRGGQDSDVLEATGNSSDQRSLANLESQDEPLSQSQQLNISEAELEKVQSEAFQAGLQEGSAVGSRQALEQVKHSLTMLGNLIETVEQQRQHIFQHAESACLDLVFAITEKIVGTLNSIHKDVVKNTLHRVMKSAEMAGRVKVLVNPNDLQTVRSMENELRQHLPDLKELSLIDDEAIAPGGCVIETDLGKVDARIQTQLNELVDNLTKLYHELSQTSDGMMPDDGNL